jgi:hypothetical protein
LGVSASFFGVLLVALNCAMRRLGPWSSGTSETWRLEMRRGRGLLDTLRTGSILAAGLEMTAPKTSSPSLSGSAGNALNGTFGELSESESGRVFNGEPALGRVPGKPRPSDCVATRRRAWILSWCEVRPRGTPSSVRSSGSIMTSVAV